MTQAFVQSFSQGQITIPKKIRDELNLDKNFWLRLFVDDKKRIIAEPVKETKDKNTYLKSLSEVKGGWFDISENKKTRSELNKRLSLNDANTY